MLLKLFLLTFLLFPIPYSFAEQTCQIPKQLQEWDYNATRAIAKGQDWKNTSVETDYWMLSLSWSNAYCDTFENRRMPKHAKHQCLNNDFGLVVHGLWAQSRKAGRNVKMHPRNCRDTSVIPATKLKKHLCEIPGTRLIQKEWEKHGTCDFNHPGEYLDTMSALYRKLKLPAKHELKGLEYSSWKKVKRKIVEINKTSGLRDEHLHIEFKKNRLKEVRVCYDLEYRFTSCK